MSEDNQNQNRYENLPSQEELAQLPYDELATRCQETIGESGRLHRQIEQALRARDKYVAVLQEQYIARLLELARPVTADNVALEPGDIVEDEFGVRYRVYDAQMDQRMTVQHILERVAQQAFGNSRFRQSPDPDDLAPLPETWEDVQDRFYAMARSYGVKFDRQGAPVQRAWGIRLSRNGVEQHSQPRMIGSPHIRKVEGPGRLGE